jgi:hypothetical protein
MGQRIPLVKRIAGARISSRSEAEKVIALIVGSALAGSSAVGWYGYKTLVRIQTWGEKMNELDAIFQSVATPDELAGFAGKATAGGTPAKSAAAAAVAPVAVGVPH